MSLARLAEQLQAGELSPSEAVAESLARIESLDGALNAFLFVRAEEALAEAAALERDPQRGPLYGVPIAVKDVIDVAGAPTTAASRILADNVPTVDATSVARLRAAGAVIVGKLNTHEFAFGATTTSPHFGPARNPWDHERICGGSSGGSGAAAARGSRARRARHRHRRLDPHPCLPLRRHGPAADDGSRLDRRCRAGLVDVRHRRPARAQRGGLRAAPRGDRRVTTRRPRSARVPVPRYTEELGIGVDGLRVGVVSHLFDERWSIRGSPPPPRARSRSSPRSERGSSAWMPRSCDARRSCSSS